MIKSTPDIDALIDETDFRSGAFRLWVAVLLDAVMILKGEKIGSRGLAESFIFDQENFFFDAVCHELDYEPVLMRQRIRKAIEGDISKGCTYGCRD